ncbi:NAD(P)/FAD-dependent oxidoreductase [Hyphobacterium marinum]|uniref:FAD-dependent oxidoreductase n=1 Tax=Hyphobacterium marinum TaxID=3116574 RepID=A0ABU7LWX8_9PROT|nr:FAD-dependent oxidoreductase [Hyphobacterium sp. Y6023]MEE2565705.1 FAD-dependent oxidoreductase [Hyphobacterium sp. Y6023]
MSDTIVILGAGQAGAQLADSLRREGHEGPIVLVGEEADPPYQRPPLSKTFLMDTFDEARLPLRPDAFYTDRKIDLRTGVTALSINRTGKTVALSDGSTLPYDKLVIATGTRVRTPPIPGIDGDRVYPLRTLSDSRAIKSALTGASHVVVIGGGFIGLETASAARTMGKSVTVLEAMDRLMQRAVSAPVSAFFDALHRDKGVDLVYGVRVANLNREGRSVEVELDDGRVFIADMVILGAGVIPNQEIAEAAGITCSNGIDADDYATTSDPDIYAIGDVSFHPNALRGRRLRLESVQNATDQARALAKTLTGTPTPYTAVPWFWSDQYDVKLQMAGLSDGFDTHVERRQPGSDAFSIFYFLDGKLIGADSVNAPADHMAARRILAQAEPALTPEEAADPAFDLKTRM